MKVDSRSHTRNSCDRALRLVPGGAAKPVLAVSPVDVIPPIPSVRTTAQAPVAPARMHVELNRLLLQSRSSIELYRCVLELLERERTSGNALGSSWLDEVQGAFSGLLADCVGQVADASLSLRQRAALIGILQEVPLEDTPGFLISFSLWLGDQLEGWLEAAVLDPDLRPSYLTLLRLHRVEASLLRCHTDLAEVASHRQSEAGAVPLRLRAVGRGQ